MLIIIFEAYVTNLGKYNEGELLSEPLKFPAATEEVQAEQSLPSRRPPTLFLC